MGINTYQDMARFRRMPLKHWFGPKKIGGLLHGHKSLKLKTNYENS